MSAVFMNIEACAFCLLGGDLLLCNSSCLFMLWLNGSWVFSHYSSCLFMLWLNGLWVFFHYKQKKTITINIYEQRKRTKMHVLTMLGLLILIIKFLQN
jgi:hypothetical protein